MERQEEVQVDIYCDYLFLLWQMHFCHPADPPSLTHLSMQSPKCPHCIQMTLTFSVSALNTTTREQNKEGDLLKNLVAVKIYIRTLWI